MRPASFNLQGIRSLAVYQPLKSMLWEAWTTSEVQAAQNGPQTD